MDLSEVSTGEDSTSATINHISVKMENLQIENQFLKTALSRMSDRLESEVISASDDSSISGDEKDPNVNTLHMQRDELFTASYFYLTDVSFVLIVFSG